MNKNNYVKRYVEIEIIIQVVREDRKNGQEKYSLMRKPKIKT